MRHVASLTALVLLMAALTCHAEEVSLKHQGLIISANLETVGQAWRQKPLVLITHGTLAHNRMEIIQALQNTFKERGYSSLAINLSLGLSERKGMYDCAIPHTHRHTDAIDEIGRWLDWLKDQGVTSVVLLGHSRGGNQTAWFAAEHDDAIIRSLILVAPQTWSEHYAAADYKKRFHKALAPRLAEAARLVKSGKAEQMMKGIDLIYCENTSATARTFLSYYNDDQRMDTPYLLQRLNKPVLVIAGSEDNVVADLIGKMQPIADGKRVQLVEISGADHFFRDLYIDEVVDSAVTFMEAH
ncbi:MAG TPA: alpha/beta fold hydrolase [Gammaproteobacteria bacterium]